jgi:hypothetical protein
MRYKDEIYEHQSDSKKDETFNPQLVDFRTIKKTKSISQSDSSKNLMKEGSFKT